MCGPSACGREHCSGVKLICTWPSHLLSDLHSNNRRNYFVAKLSVAVIKNSVVVGYVHRVASTLTYFLFLEQRWPDRCL